MNAAETEAPAAQGSGFASLDTLRDQGHFKFDEREVELPELNPDCPPKLLLCQLTVADRHSLTRQLPDNPADWQHKHTALSLAKYVADPSASTDEWTEIIKPWPSPALDRVNREMRRLIDVGEKEETAAALEFRESE
jgi:hypothetical protein